MRKLLWLVSLIATLLLALAALFLLLPGLKEGFSFSEMPYYAAGAGGLLVCGIAWWLATGRSLRHAAPALVILAIPLLAYLAVIAEHVLAYFEGRRFAQSLAVVGYSESRIDWPGFDGAVGLRLTLELTHDAPPRGVLYPPELRMAPASNRTHSFADLVLGGGYAGSRDKPLAVLKEVLFRHPPRQRADTRTLDDSGRSHVTFELLPGAIEMIRGSHHLCLDASVPGLPICTEGALATMGCVRADRYRPVDPAYRDGSDLSAIWLFAGGSDMIADLSPQLTKALRHYSQMQGAAEAWTAMQKRLEPSGLTAAGYRLCPPGEDSHSSFRVCYCR